MRFWIHSGDVTARSLLEPTKASVNFIYVVPFEEIGMQSHANFLDRMD